MSRLATLVFIVVPAALVGCGDGGREARRADAIDVAGTWLEVVTDGRPAASLRIDNESSINDVRAIVGRGDDDDALDVDEAAFVARLTDPNDRLAVRSNLELGAGIDGLRDEVDGGENVSFDEGASTSVTVISAAFPADVDDVRVASQRWGLALDGDASELRGVLFITTLEQRARADDSNGVFSAARRFERSIVFRR